jgi:hypothetical protein
MAVKCAQPLVHVGDFQVDVIHAHRRVANVFLDELRLASRFASRSAVKKILQCGPKGARWGQEAN